MSTDKIYMERALELACRARGRTSPNPMVGCVLVHDGQIIGEGFHEKAGKPHAEINALDAAGNAKNATMYVTLEPCTFFGRTPPCVDRIIRESVAHVVVAMEDPNPRVSGQGIQRLQDAGISVDVGLLETEARQLNEVFIKYITTRMPFVTVKCAMTLDGKIATCTGDSRWVTGEASRKLVHQLRNEVDAILVGSRTVMLDNPSLTTRIATKDKRDPVRVILDADDYLDSNRKVFHLDSQAPTWVVVPHERDFEGADETLHILSANEGIDLVQLMLELGARNITSVLIEGGGATHAGAFEAGIVDKVLFFIAPKIVGGQDAVTAVEGKGIERMENAIPLERLSPRIVGEDLLVEAYVKKG